MSDELLPYYNRELAYIRRLAGQFADKNPHVAIRLRLGPEGIAQDPHVERLIEGFAYLTARVRHKIDDEFPEITEALLGVLYPHYQAPVPSMAIVQMELDPEQEPLSAGTPVPAGTELESEPIQDEPCRFRTCYPLTLWPVRITSATLSQPPFEAPVTPASGKAVSVLRLVLEGLSPTVLFSGLEIGSLRFYLSGQSQHTHPLYELIFNHVVEVAVATGVKDPQPVLLDRTCVRPVGFDRHEGMLPLPSRSFPGYRLLSEFFAFPEKFLFFDLVGLTGAALARAENRLELFFFLNRAVPDLEHNLSEDNFRLGCTPMINLYRQLAEPIALTHTEFEYHVVPDARRPRTHEVYSVERVTAVSQDHREVDYLPFFSVKHAARGNGAGRFWHTTRRSAESAADPDTPDGGTEVYLSLVDADMAPSADPGWTLTVETTCLNRDLPHRLRFGGDEPRLQLTEGRAPVKRLTCLTPPTATFRPAMKRGVLWRLISHLSLNHLSLVDNDRGAEALREILTLYDFAGKPASQAAIAGVREVNSRRVTCRVTSGGTGAVCRGVEASVRFDRTGYAGGGVYLFAAVLERFLAQYCSVNSFSRLVATTVGHEGELGRWPPRSGEKVLV
jgi:type VI secretion system protein ImpG